MTEERTAAQASMLANRVRKRLDHLSRKFAREGIDVFRLYDWDIPEIRAVVDWYAGRLVVGEYSRKQTGPEWLPAMARAVRGSSIRVEDPRDRPRSLASTSHGLVFRDDRTGPRGNRHPFQPKVSSARHPSVRRALEQRASRHFALGLPRLTPSGHRSILDSEGGSADESSYCQQRSQPLDLAPEFCSLTTGSVNFGDEVFENTFPLIKGIAGKAVAGFAAEAGRPIATPEQAREMLRIPLGMC